MLFSNTLKATAAASLVLACAGVNAQSTWKSSQDLGLFVNPTKGIPSNVTIGASPTSSLSNTRLTVKSEDGQGGLKVINSEGSTKLWLNEKGGLSVGTSSSATTNGLLVSGQTRLRANLVVDNGADIKGGMKVDGEADINGKTQLNGETTINLSRWKSSFTVNANHESEKAIFNCFTEFNEDTHLYSVLSIRDKDLLKNSRGPELCFFHSYSLNSAIISSIYWQSSTPPIESKLNPLGIYANYVNFLEDCNVAIGWNGRHIPNHKFEVNGDGYFTGKLTCKGQIEVTALNSDAINVNSLNAKDINMDMHGAADYVFDENYNLKSLSEVESYVNENKHLPGMPSAAEMEENGVSVSKMTNLLLEKVEELTLHMIQLEKENAALKAKVESLSK